MAGVTTETRLRMSLSRRLQENASLAAKVRGLEDMARSYLGDTPIQWDLISNKPPVLSIKAGTPGNGECTRRPFATMLEEKAAMERLFQDMKATLSVLRKWLREVAELFKQIRSWIARYAPSFRVEEGKVIINEALTGEYSARKLVIRAGKKTAEVCPRGAWWLTTEGRIDVVGPDREFSLILSHDEGGWLWVKEDADVTLQPLTGETFVRLVKDCMG
jgi:hypothetical protein